MRTVLTALARTGLASKEVLERLAVGLASGAGRPHQRKYLLQNQKGDPGPECPKTRDQQNKFFIEMRFFVFHFTMPAFTVFHL
ncbi:MAG: hypothetical protein JWQ23_3164 [Herminiimonas sp.]|nr:hypothetical protein [Herminiimonas sp.]